MEWYGAYKSRVKDGMEWYGAYKSRVKKSTKGKKRLYLFLKK